MKEAAGSGEDFRDQATILARHLGGLAVGSTGWRAVCIPSCVTCDGRSIILDSLNVRDEVPSLDPGTSDRAARSGHRIRGGATAAEATV